MAGRVVLPVWVEPIADEVGLWCHRCSFSSGRRVTYAILVGERLSIGAMSKCTDCGTEL